jgi:hypothetical protein
MSIPPHNVYFMDLPALLLLVSLVYSATRYDDWVQILKETGRWLGRLVLFLGGIGVVLFFLAASR